MKNEKQIVPKFRFPEFKNEVGWENIELYDVGEIISGLTYKPEDIRSNGLLVLRSSNIKEGSIDLQDCVYVRPDIYRVNLTRQDDILICVRNGSKSLIGKNAIIKEKLPLCTHGAFMIIFRSKSAGFIYQLFQTELYYKQVEANLGATINSINTNQLKKFLFLFPKPAEQQKIADCLSSLDELISANNQKLEALKNHKKGLMQQLFPTEGEKVPMLRFKEFMKDKIWQKQTLGDISTIIIEKPNGKKYTLMSINAGGGLISQLEKFGREIAGDSYKNYIVIKKEDFAYNKSSTKQYPEGQVAMLENDEAGAVPNSIFTCFRIDKTKVIPGFLKYLFENNIHGKWLRGFIAIGARAHGSLSVDNKDLFSLPIAFPGQKEQQKIANFLCSIDVLISSQSQRIEKLKEHKKGMLQGLFPNDINLKNE